MKRVIRIGSRMVGDDSPTYIVAEMSGNHGQKFDRAVAIIQAAKDAGADAVKLQTYTPDIITINCRNEHFLIGRGTIWEGKNLYDLYTEAYTPMQWQPKLKEIAEDLGLDCFSTPFDLAAVDFLERIGVLIHKIASFELVDLPLIRRVARTGKPVIMSTGMAALSEIDEAVRAFHEEGGQQLALLKCTSAYPSPPDEINLRAIPHLAEAFNVPVGLSDHTLGISVSVAAVALGACVIEKHLTLSRAAGGPDSAFSLEPNEFRSMVEAVRMTEKALGHVSYEVTESEKASRVFRRSLFVVENIKTGEVFTDRNVRSIRPGYGLHTRHLPEVLGRESAQDIKRGTPLKWEYVATASGIQNEHH